MSEQTIATLEEFPSADEQTLSTIVHWWSAHENERVRFWLHGGNFSGQLNVSHFKNVMEGDTECVAFKILGAGGKFVGHVFLSTAPARVPELDDDDDRRRRGHVMYVYVVPEERRNGYATAAMEALEAEARGRSLERLSINVFQDNNVAIDLYHALGYHDSPRVDERKFGEESCPRQWMQLTL